MAAPNSKGGSILKNITPPGIVVKKSAWPAPARESDLTIRRYGSRYFAVYDGDGLVAVTLYKKGAQEVVRRLGFSA